jgi:hypothetical protein
VARLFRLRRGPRGHGVERLLQLSSFGWGLSAARTASASPTGAGETEVQKVLHGPLLRVRRGWEAHDAAAAQDGTPRRFSSTRSYTATSSGSGPAPHNSEHPRSTMSLREGFRPWRSRATWTSGRRRAGWMMAHGTMRSAPSRRTRMDLRAVSDPGVLTTDFTDFTDGAVLAGSFLHP